MPRIIAEHIDQYREKNGIVKCYKVGELIRCKDCRRHDTDGYCFEIGIKTDAEHYCAWAEREEK